MANLQVYGFVGPSGTGKSYRVTEVARENKIPLIIDDGLLIREGNAIAGVSAKGEKTKFASVKRALFFAPEHAREVRRAIRQEQADKILIVGTSVAMVQKIAEALSLPTPEKIISITDVATRDEIETAQHIRRTEGKHVIPVPTFQIRKDFSGYWLDPLQLFRPAVKEEAAAFFGITLHQDKEILMMVVEKSIRDNVLNAIYKQMGMDKKAKGITFSLPVSDVAGLAPAQVAAEEAEA